MMADYGLGAVVSMLGACYALVRAWRLVVRLVWGSV